MSPLLIAGLIVLAILLAGIVLAIYSLYWGDPMSEVISEVQRAEDDCLRLQRRLSRRGGDA